MVAVLLEMVHTEGVEEVIVTGSPEDAVAVTVKGVTPRPTLGSAAKVMVCGVMDGAEIVKVWLTGGAALYVLLPFCVAVTVQEPAASNAPMFPDTPQVAGVEEEKLTSSPELAVALTLKVPEARVRFAKGPKVMVCGLRAGETTATLSVTGGAAA